MATYPKELIFRARQDIDQFLSEPGLNSALYDALLSVREPGQFRYALKVTPLELFNEAYGQALRVLLDKHPEEDYYHNYQLNAKKYFQRTYEAELVFCLVYVLLFFSNETSPNVKRFIEEIRRRMERDQAYFPTFSKFVEDICSDPTYDPGKDRFYLHTDVITKEELFSIRWELATNNYDETTIWQYLRVAPDLEYQLAIMKHIRESFELDNAFSNYALEDKTPLFDKIERICKSRPKQPTPLPVIEAPYDTEEEETVDPEDVSLEDIRNLSQQDDVATLKEQLAQKDAEISHLRAVFAENTSKIKELNTQAEDLQKKLDQALDLAQQLQEKHNAEAETDPADEIGERTMAIVTITLVRILKEAGMGKSTGGFDDVDAAKLIQYFTKYSWKTVRKQVPKSRIPKTALKEVAKVNKLLSDANLDISIK